MFTRFLLTRKIALLYLLRNKVTHMGERIQWSSYSGLWYTMEWYCGKVLAAALTASHETATEEDWVGVIYHSFRQLAVKLVSRQHTAKVAENTSKKPASRSSTPMSTILSGKACSELGFFGRLCVRYCYHTCRLSSILGRCWARTKGGHICTRSTVLSSSNSQ